MIDLLRFKKYYPLLDIEGFQNAWIAGKELKLIQAIASDILNVEDIEQQPDLKQALLQAYQGGKKSSPDI